MSDEFKGRRFGRLVTVRPTTKGGGSWLCVCDCGKESEVRKQHLLRGATKSCGCFKQEVAGNASRKHGRFGTRVYRSYHKMIRRCYCESDPFYRDYGGRGIKVCDRWRHSFENFLADMGDPPDGHSLDRINNGGDYTPENCKWSTPTEQSLNRRSNVKVTFQERTQTATEWARELGLPPNVVLERLRKGWTGERALTQPPRLRNPKH